VQLKTDGTLQIVPVGGTSLVNSAASAALNNDQWYCVEMVHDSSTTSSVARLYVDEVATASDASMTLGGTGIHTQSYIGICISVTSTTAVDLYFDDLILGTATGVTDTFGPTDGIVGLVPNGDGTHNPSTPVAGRFKDAAGVDISGSNPAWDNIDSGDLTQTAERISQPVIAATEYLEVNLTTTTLSVAAPVGVIGFVGLNSDGTNAFTAKTSVFNGAAETIIFNGDWSFGAGVKAYRNSAMITVADQTALDGLKVRLGYGNSQPAIPYWEGVMVEVDVGQTTAPPEPSPLNKRKFILSDAVHRASRY
jgi:hypothetical protein